MPAHPVTHELGRIDVVTLADAPALSRDVPLDLDAIQAAWPVFESGFDSLQGRRMRGLVLRGQAIYRLSSLRLERDADNLLGLAETVIPGGDYLRLRLRGEPAEVYGRIGRAFEVLFASADDDHDAARPHIESYRREGEVDCLVPIRPTP